MYKAVIMLLALVATLELGLILVMLRNRRRYKATRSLLKQSQTELSDRVEERTQRLNDLNKALSNEAQSHQKTSELLRESRAYINRIINSLPSMLIGVTEQGMITHWNDKAESYTSLAADQALGQSFELIFPDLPVNLDTIRDCIDHNVGKHIERVQQEQRQSPTQKHEQQESHEKGDPVFMDIAVLPLKSDTPSGAVILIQDITMRVNVENMMIQNDKMLSLGELAAGTAHEVNNPLGAVIQGVQNIKRRISPDLAKNVTVANELDLSLETINNYLTHRNIDTFLDNIEEAGKRASQIVTNMLSFSRSRNDNFQPTNIDELIDNTLMLLRNTSDKDSGMLFDDITIEKRYPSYIPTIECAAGEIQQVIINIIKNAFQALASEKIDPPTITITLDSDDFYLNCEITDNGKGISDIALKHLFEPFYTTKDIGKGTGLGLSIAYFIITEHHKGIIKAENPPEGGARFMIRLPIQANSDPNKADKRALKA